jgi:hypothetical protein
MFGEKPEEAKSQEGIEQALEDTTSSASNGSTIGAKP